MCDWCGHAHPRTALCTKRPTWGRRGFLALMGAALVGAVVPPPVWDTADLPWANITFLAQAERVSTDAFHEANKTNVKIRELTYDATTALWLAS
jgi:hypothetical protein